MIVGAVTFLDAGRRGCAAVEEEDVALGAAHHDDERATGVVAGDLQSASLHRDGPDRLAAEGAPVGPDHDTEVELAGPAAGVVFAGETEEGKAGGTVGT